MRDQALGLGAVHLRRGFGHFHPGKSAKLSMVDPKNEKGRIMAKPILIDEFHLTFYVPRGLPDSDGDAIRQTLDTSRFRRQLRQAFQDVIRQHPALSRVRVTVTR
jgi:hypothetical protein